MKKYGYKFKRDYTIRVMPTPDNNILIGKLSSKKKKGGVKVDETTDEYLNPVKVIEKLDDNTVKIEDGRLITIHKGIGYISCGLVEAQGDPATSHQ